MITQEKENETDGRLPFTTDSFLEKIKNTLWLTYEPTLQYSPGVFTMSSLEIFNNLQKLYPVDTYSVADVANWLHEKGFTFIDMGQMRWEWMLKPTSEL